MQRKPKFQITAVILTAVLLFAGCHGPTQNTTLTSLMAVNTAETGQAGRSAENRPIECCILGTGPDVIMVIGAIHGDEPASGLLAYKLKDYLKAKPKILTGKTVILIPVANPDGVAKNTRFNARGIDLNRNFPAKNRLNNKTNGLAALCEPESNLLYRLIEKYKPSRIISIHEPYGCIDYDGPAEQIATHMAKFSRLPVKKLGARPGSMGAYVGETRSIPIITVELDKTAASLNTKALWRQHSKMILAAITYPQDPK